MPRDATKMPNPRSAPYRLRDKVTHAVDKLDTTLNIENMLLEEFNYASVAAYQAMEDRARMFNIYLLLIGVIASGLGAIYQLGGSANSYLRPAAILLLLITGIVRHLSFVLRLLCSRVSVLQEQHSSWLTMLLFSPVKYTPTLLQWLSLPGCYS